MITTTYRENTAPYVTARTVEFLETLSELAEFAPMRDTWREWLEHQESKDRPKFAEMLTDFDIDLDLDATDGNNPLDKWLENDVLEIRETGHRSIGGEWESDGFSVLISFGGPNTWLEITPRTNTVYTAWGSDTDRQPVDVDYIERVLTEWFSF